MFFHISEGALLFINKSTCYIITEATMTALIFFVRLAYVAPSNNVLIHSADPQSRPVGIIVFTHVIRT